MRNLFFGLVLLLVPAAYGQGQMPLPGADGSPPRIPEGCPLRSVNEGLLERISPEGHLVFRYKGQLMVAKTTSETRYRIPGYTKRQLHAGQLIKLQPGTRAKMRICERTGEVVEMKILELGKQPDADSEIESEGAASSDSEPNKQ